MEKIFGLIGFPLSHSFSQRYFTEKFKAEGINARYLNFELPDIGELMTVFAEYPELQGLNVTIPYKEQVIPYLDEIDRQAASIGAVNVVKVIPGAADNDFRLKGFNTDVTGFELSIKPLLNAGMEKALVLGTGGASKAVVAGLRDLGVEALTVSRSEGRGQLTYSGLTPDIMRSHKVIVNATPAGMSPHTDECPPIPYGELTPAHLCFDLIYNPAETLFMKKAAERGATVKNGMEMLKLQADEAWKIWNEI